MASVSIQAWLKEIDRGAYDKNWEDSSMSLKKKFTETRWIAVVQAERSPFGECLSRFKINQFHIPSRTFRNGVVTKDLVIDTYKTSFSKSKALETVVSEEEPDGVWRASSYTILRQ
jgi:hypothetical protein